MRGTSVLLACAITAALWLPAGIARDSQLSDPASQTADAVEIVRYEAQYSRAHIEPARLGEAPGLAVIFQGTDDLHYYARPETAPAAGLELKVEATSPHLAFGQAVLPQWTIFNDPAAGAIHVYVGDFTVFVPIREETIADAPQEVDVTVRIAGIACTSMLCLPPFEKTVAATIDPGTMDAWTRISLEPAEVTPEVQATPEAAEPATGTQVVATPTGQPASLYGTGVYYLLAIIAGLSINIMPCVLPILPLILMRLIDQARHSSGRRIAAGLAFCGGVVLFFAAFALVAAIINLSTGAVLDLNSLFRYPAAVTVLFLAIVFFGLAMLDIVTLSLPSSVAGQQGAASGIAGSVGMGFFAGILSTPCSGALLGFVLVWAQTQPVLVSSLAIVLMGVGMALPYAVIVLVPSLLNRVPKPGSWMEIFKKSTGFLLFLIAVKLTLAALPKDRLLNVLTYGVIFSFCVWMWGKWVGFSTPAARKWTIRLTALAIAVAAGLWLLPARALPAGLRADWQSYERDLVDQAVAQDRPVLLKFTADWCTNCKIVERRVYQDAEILELVRAKNVLAIKADTTLIDYAATQDFKDVYGEAGNVPVSILLLPDGSQKRLRGIFDKDELAEILEELPEGKS